MHANNHPLYKNEKLVAAMADQFIEGGHTVFQLFQFPGGERHHSAVLLTMADLPPEANCVSFGCGVGGMERYWQDIRPDIKWTLINTSQAQLDRCLAKGDKVWSDVERWIGEKTYDVVVIAYVMGHVESAKVFDRAFACLKPNGKVVVYDIYNLSQRAEDVLMYHPKDIWLRPEWHGEFTLPLVSYMKNPTTEFVEREATPFFAVFKP